MHGGVKTEQQQDKKNVFLTSAACSDFVILELQCGETCKRTVAVIIVVSVPTITEEKKNTNAAVTLNY